MTRSPRRRLPGGSPSWAPIIPAAPVFRSRPFCAPPGSEQAAGFGISTAACAATSGHAATLPRGRGRTSVGAHETHIGALLVAKSQGKAVGKAPILCTRAARESLPWSPAALAGAGGTGDDSFRRTCGAEPRPPSRESAHRSAIDEEQHMPMQDGTGRRGSGRGRGQGQGRGRGSCGGRRMRAGRGGGRRGVLEAGETPIGHPEPRGPATPPLSKQIAQLRVRLEQLETGATSDTV